MSPRDGKPHAAFRHLVDCGDLAGTGCTHAWTGRDGEFHGCAELIQDPPTDHVHRCCCGATTEETR
jgi:hypothetical protein